MTDQLDTELRDRLAGLAAAAPVDAPGTTSVLRPRIRSGSAGGRFAFGGLIPVLAVLVIGTVIAGLANLGPFAPESTATADPPNGPVVATTSDGLFELTIRSTKARYVADEPIEIEASLTYRGSDPIQIAHGQGARGTALGFGIDEPVLGDLRLTPGVLESCERSTLEPGAPLNVAFEKSGGFSGEDPRAAEYRAYFEDPVLRLPVGTWHVFAVADFFIEECSAEADLTELRVDIEIEVLPGPLPLLEGSAGLLVECGRHRAEGGERVGLARASWLDSDAGFPRRSAPDTSSPPCMRRLACMRRLGCQRWSACRASRSPRCAALA